MIKAVAILGLLYVVWRLLQRRKKEPANSTLAPSEDVYIHTGNVIYRADGAPISDEEVPYLIQLGAENARRTGAVERSPREEELCALFFQKHINDVRKLEDELYAAAGTIGPAGKKWLKTASKADIEEKIQRCDRAINAFTKLGSFCRRHGKGGSIYFSDVWEHCHNSKNPDFSYIAGIVSLRDELQQLL